MKSDQRSTKLVIKHSIDRMLFVLKLGFFALLIIGTFVYYVVNNSAYESGAFNARIDRISYICSKLKQSTCPSPKQLEQYSINKKAFSKWPGYQTAYDIENRESGIPIGIGPTPQGQ